MRAAFNVGARVRTKAQRGGGHTRLPGYLQNKSGVIERIVGGYPLPDERAAGRRDGSEQRLYTVRFAAAAVWPDGPSGDTVCADLFEEYLEPGR